MGISCVKLAYMRQFAVLFLLLLWSLSGPAAPHFIVLGGADKPVGVFIQPLTYHGPGVSPAVDIENILLSRLSQSGLFYQPWGIQPNPQWHLNHWRLAGVRYVISGVIEETEQVIDLRLTVTDTLGTTPTFVWVELNAEAWQQATRVFARQLLYSLFYATHTDNVDNQYLRDVDPDKTRYWMALVKALKNSWQNHQSHGECRVEITQLPGGRVQSYDFARECEQGVMAELMTLFERLNTLPYRGMGAPFVRTFTVNFVARP